MPTIAEKAKAEADQVEAEEQEQQPTEEPAGEPTEEPAGEPTEEPAPEPEPHPGEGLEEPSDQMIAELQAACNDHHDHVRAIMGPFVDGFVPCETCNGIGIAYPTPAGRRLQPAPGLAECSVCKGEGDLDTPSHRDGFDVIQCINCGGKGYVGNLAGVPHEVQQQVETYPQTVDGVNAPAPETTQPASTDPRVQQLRAEGYIVLEKPNA